MFEDVDIERLEIKNPVLTFEHPLTMEEKEELVYEIMGNNQLKHVYFIDEVNTDTIEFVKLLLEYSIDISDSDIEKAILLRDPSNIIVDLLNMNFKNPSTWYVSFKNNGVSYEVVDLPSLRLMEKFLINEKERIESKTTSNLEKILLAYDLVKLFDYNSNDELSSIPDIIQNELANSKGFNLLFSTILSRLGIKSFVGEMMTGEDISYITLVDIMDEKYSINGMYLFDPASDSLPARKYKEKGIRRLNYNFFGLSIDSINYLKTGDELAGILSVFSIQNSKFRNQRIDIISKRDNGMSKRSIIESMAIGIDDIYDKCHNVKTIGIDVILEVISNVCYTVDYTENKELDVVKLIRDNYISREKELFNERFVLDEEIEI